MLARLEPKLLMVAFEQAESMLAAESCLELRYQHVVERPREQVERRLSYLQLEWTDGFERSIAGLKFPPAGARMYRDELTPDVGVRNRAVRPVLHADACPSDC